MDHLHHVLHDGTPYPMEGLLKKIQAWFLQKGRCQAFWGAFISGLCCHLYAMTNMLPTSDWQYNFYKAQNMVMSGRWALEAACRPSSNAIVPMVNGLLSLLYIALAAVFIVDLLELDRPLLATLAGACMSIFPSAASTLAYIYTADGYTLALLLAVLSAWCCLRWRKWFLGCIPAFLMLGYSMGIYQSFGSFTLLLFCLFLVLSLLRRMPSLQELFGTVMRMAITAGLGFIFYYIMMRYSLAHSGQRLTLYQGIDCLNNEVQFCLSGMIYQFHLLSNARHFGLKFITQELPRLGGGVWGFRLVWAMYLLLAVFYVLAFILKKQWKKWYAPLVHLAVILVFPLGINYVQVISPDVHYHMIMHYSAVLLFILVLCLAQILCDDKDTVMLVRKCVSVSSTVVCVLLLFYWVVITNVGYTNMQYQYQKSYANMIRLADRIEQSEGYADGAPVWITEAVWPGEDTPIGDQSNFIGMEGIHQFDPYHYYMFLRHLIGTDIHLASYEDFMDIVPTKEFQEMPLWPDTGSVKTINGVIVVKTGQVPY